MIVVLRPVAVDVRLEGDVGGIVVKNVLSGLLAKFGVVRLLWQPAQ